jgi:hypothetical protein
MGVGMDDPHEIGQIRSIQLAGDLHCYPLTRARREPVDITDQRDHGPNRSLLHLRIRCLGGHICGKDSASRVVLKRTLNTPRLSAKKANWVPLQLFVGWGPN